MRLRDAKRLHNRDMVRLKRTKEVGYVLGEPELVPAYGKYKQFLRIPVQFPNLGCVTIAHDEIE